MAEEEVVPPQEEDDGEEDVDQKDPADADMKSRARERTKPPHHSRFLWEPQGAMVGRSAEATKLSLISSKVWVVCG